MKVTLAGHHSTAVVHLLGATVLSFVPKGQGELLFVSPRSHYTVGTPIRGGIPVCWPWFSNRTPAPGLPSHGVARQRLWTLVEQGVESGVAYGRFQLEHDEETLALWPHPFRFVLEVRAGRELSVRFTHTNLDTVAVSAGGALHTYYAVLGPQHTTIPGLAGLTTWDKPTDTTAVQPESFAVRGEFDRIFFDAPDLVQVVTPVRTLNVHKDNAPDVVIWNPGAKGALIADLGAEAAKHFVCVEAVVTEPIVIAPGEDFSFGMRVAVAPAE